MSELKSQEQLRDDIASVLELSRASWKTPKGEDRAEQDTLNNTFPRSMLFQTLNNHPLLSAAAVASIWYLGPARFSAMAVAGVSLFMRHRLAIMPIATQLVGANIFRSKNK